MPKGQPASVAYFAFLPGGSHGLLYLDCGIFQLWDLSAIQELEVPTSSSSDELEESTDEGNFERAGKHLRTFDAGFQRLSIFDFNTSQNDTTVTVAAVAQAESESNRIVVFSFNNIDKERVDVVEHFATDIPHGSDLPDLVLKGSLIVVPHYSTGNDAVWLSVIDYTTKAIRAIQTGIIIEAYATPDMFVSDDGHFGIHYSNQTSLTVHVYFDFLSRVAQSANEQHANLPPDATRAFPYHPGSCFPSNSPWDGLQPWNVPNATTRGYTSVVATSTLRAEASPTRWTCTSHWMDINAFIAAARSPQMEFPLLHRDFYINPEASARLSFIREIMAGTYGKHVVWQRSSAGDDGNSLTSIELLTLRFAGEAEEHDRSVDLSESTGYLRVEGAGVRLEDTSCLHFADEFGTLAIGSSFPTEAGYLNSITLVDY